MTPEAPGESSLSLAAVVASQPVNGTVRLSPSALRALGLRPGGFVAVSGARRTAVRAVPSAAVRPLEIEIDATTASNAGAGNGEAVDVSRAVVPDGIMVTVSFAAEAARMTAAALEASLRRAMRNCALTEGDAIAITGPGGGTIDGVVSQTSPQGVCAVTDATVFRIVVDGEALRPRRGYAAIGGIGRELTRIRELIELPLRHPEAFRRLGIQPPKGVLLSGPPGCGKTMIARAVAEEARAAFFTVNGPEIIDRFYGASEAQLRSVFEEAEARAPSIVFIDEIDAIAPKRAVLSGEKQVERRIVAQLLTLLDGLRDRGQVIVIGATNIPDSLDPALRRPGRFDREIALAAPDAAGRAEILAIHARAMPLAPDVLIETIARRTPGYVGADLAAVMREAGMAALRRFSAGAPGSAQPALASALSSLKVSNADIDHAIGEVSPSALREFAAEVPAASWESIAGYDAEKQALVEAVALPILRPELFEADALRPPRGVLVYGPPGTGKSRMVAALAAKAGMNLITVRGPQLVSMWLGETERAVREVFQKARTARPCLIFFDEIDALAGRRSAAASADTDRVVGQLLTEIDRAGALRGITVVAATNRPEQLDPALVRPGRFDLHVRFGLPDVAARRGIYAVHTRALVLDGGVDIGELAAASEGWSGADIESVCQIAARQALRRLLGSDHPSGDGGLPPLTLGDFEQAFAVMARRAGGPS